MLRNVKRTLIAVIIFILLNTLILNATDITIAKEESLGLSKDEKALISRAEFIKMVVNILEVDTKIGSTSVNFKDVAKDDWFYPYVEKAYNAGIIKGDGSKFNPYENITREEMATIISRALRLEDFDILESELKDLKSVSPWAKEHVNKCVYHKLLIGNEQKLFLPKQYATKEMATVTTMRAYEKINRNKQEILEKTMKQN